MGWDRSDFTMKLHLGCGDNIIPGWLNADAFSEKADVRFDAKHIPYQDNQFDELYASHLIEHFHYQESFDVLREWCRVLKPGGKLKLETPDFIELCKEFVAGDVSWRWHLYGHFFSTPWVPGHTHLFLYTEEHLAWALRECGFTNIQRIEPESGYYKSLPHKKNIFLAMEAYKNG
jgi:SAM-dependent methyltransferase